MLSNPNIIGPLGTQTVTYGNEVFDEAAYNRAMEAYQSRGGRGEMPSEAQFRVYDQDTGAFGLDQPGYMRALAQWAAAGGAAPTREQFTTRTNLDIPTVRQTLTPEAQATLEAQQRVDRQLAQLGEQGIGTAQRALSTPFAPNLPPVRTDLGLYGDVARAPDITGMGMARGGPAAPSLQAGLGYTGEILGAPDLAAAGIARGGVRAPRLQGRLEPVGGPVRGVSLTGLGQAETDVLAPSLRSNIDLTGLAAMPVGAGATAQQAILARLEPSLARSRAALENQLVNQGIPRGSEAYRAAMTEQSQQENDLRSQAALQGLNLDMAARQQGLAEATGLASFANQAQLAGFGAQMQRQQAANQALAQNQAALAQQAQIENAAQQQAFNQAVASGQFGNAAQLASFGAGLQNQQAYNQAVAQNQAMLAQQQQMQNAAQQQAFNQALASGQFGNQAQLAAFGAGLQSTEAANQALAQNQAAALQQQQAANAAQTQAFNQALAAAQFGNTAQQQALQQQLMLRAQPLNEIIGLMGGSQIQMPQFGGYQPTQVTPAPIFGAAQAAGQNAMQQYGIAQSGINAQTSALGNLFGTAAGLYLRSDRRLKSKIVRVGTHPRGFGIYEYDIDGRRERGVMAQEVLPILPHAVRMMPDGYLAVNYGAL